MGRWLFDRRLNDLWIYYWLQVLWNFHFTGIIICISHNFLIAYIHGCWASSVDPFRGPLQWTSRGPPVDLFSGSDLWTSPVDLIWGPANWAAMIFFIYENFLLVLFCMPSNTPLFAFNSGVEYYIRKVFIVLFFHFLAKCAMQADDAFCYFNVVFFVPPFSFRSPLYNCTFDAEEFVKSVVHKMSGVDFCAATATQEKHNPSTASAASTLVRGGGISRKIIKRPKAQQTAWFHSTPLTSTHTRNFSTTFTSYK